MRLCDWIRLDWSSACKQSALHVSTYASAICLYGSFYTIESVQGLNFWIGMEVLDADSIILDTRIFLQIFQINKKFNTMSAFLDSIFQPM